MKTQPSIELHMHCPASEALQRIVDATAREGLPFIEPTRPRDRDFLSHVSGNRFRIWKWSARHRGRRNNLVPMLRGEVREAEDGSHLSARFVLHPFAMIWMPLATIIFLGIAAKVWFQSNDLKGKLFAGFFLLFGCLIGFSTLTGHGREQEETQVAQFVENLFRDVRM